MYSDLLADKSQFPSPVPEKQSLRGQKFINSLFVFGFAIGIIILIGGIYAGIDKWAKTDTFDSTMNHIVSYFSNLGNSAALFGSGIAAFGVMLLAYKILRSENSRNWKILAGIITVVAIIAIGMSLIADKDPTVKFFDGLKNDLKAHWEVAFSGVVGGGLLLALGKWGQWVARHEQFDPNKKVEPLYVAPEHSRPTDDQRNAEEREKRIKNHGWNLKNPLESLTDDTLSPSPDHL